MKHEIVSGAVDVLMAEHRQIERVLQALSDIVRYSQSTRRAPNASTIRKIVEFAEKFADGRHHEKEEKVLFSEMHAQGYSMSSGPLACMMKQHESGRALVAVLRRWTEANPAFREQHVDIAIQAGSGYVELLSSHISVEDSMLFPAALAYLSGSSLAKIEAAYKAADPVTWLEEITAAADEIVNLPPIEPSSATASASPSTSPCACGARLPDEHG
jgi:hemerythrin-like domain-containing protein